MPSDDLVPMPSDFWQRIEFHRDRGRRLARESPCPVCEVRSGEPCDPKKSDPSKPNQFLTPGAMHWNRYPQEARTAEPSPPREASFIRRNTNESRMKAEPRAHLGEER